MSDQSFINILIAEDNDVSRNMMAGIMKTAGYTALEAVDGGEAIEQCMEHRVDMAFVDINMAPQGGFEFIKHLVSKGKDIPVVIVTGDESSDILLEAQNFGVRHVIQKPVKPDTLLRVAERILKRRGFNPQAMGVQSFTNKMEPIEIMQKAIELAKRNVELHGGRPFAAALADEEGKIWGEGVNGATSRIDPTAHAEVMAIRQAAQKIGKTSLENYVLYCTNYPTKIGQALIESVGIKKVYIGAMPEDLKNIVEIGETTPPSYEQICRNDVMALIEAWAKDKDS
ncbi:MAG: response regulator [Alphaproteobacteria bacterium]